MTKETLNGRGQSLRQRAEEVDACFRRRLWSLVRSGKRACGCVAVEDNAKRSSGRILVSGKELKRNNGIHKGKKQLSCRLA